MAEALWEAVKRRGIALTDVGRRAKVSKSHVCNVKEGRRVSRPVEEAAWELVKEYDARHANDVVPSA